MAEGGVKQEDVSKYRSVLPSPMFEKNDINMWAILKNSIGKELSKITMPVIFNEPLSFLQRLTEYMQYSSLLRIASEQEEPCDRLKYVAAFAVSALACNLDRLGKPFNPLLGETYELERSEFRIICEQVSHHPPISAFHAESDSFIFHGSIHPKLKFWGKSVEIQPKGMVTVVLKKWNEAYSWQNVNCCVHNIIVGKLWIEQYGSLEIQNHVTGHKAVLNFKPGSWGSKELHRIEGNIQDKNKNKLYYLYGRWIDVLKCTSYESYEKYFKENPSMFKHSDERSKSPNESPANTPRKVFSKLNSFKMTSFKSLSIQDDHPVEVPESDIPRSNSVYSLEIPNSATLWEVEPRPENSAEYFQFTTFAMSLNEMEPHMMPPTNTLCPTDSRLRPDIRCLENGDLDRAANEKNRLEEKQRDTRKSRKTKKTEWQPRWFKLETNPYTNQDDWLYTGGYWDRNYQEDLSLF